MVILSNYDVQGEEKLWIVLEVVWQSLVLSQATR